jgi:hypothetical protein
VQVTQVPLEVKKNPSLHSEQEVAEPEQVLQFVSHSKHWELYK